MRFSLKGTSCSPFGLDVKPPTMLLSPRPQAGIPAPRALLSPNAPCLAWSFPCPEAPCVVKAAFHLLAKVLPKCKSSELITAPGSENECPLLRGCWGICRSFGSRSPLPCAVLAQPMWLRLCCHVAPQKP